ncbi:MAG: ShlB/FhaC/HecB family hemolysin secretion/activation protein [Holophaga sp.]|nr:ShlB/FhaC/HecB family hemolysin secretion/activation protein [Holophaga sp.]
MKPGVILVLAALAAARAVAQTPVIPPSADPGAIQRRQMEEEQRRRQEEQERLRRTAPIDQGALARPAEKPVDNTTRFLVREITFSSSRILSRAQLEKAAAAYKGREVTLADLQGITAALNAEYQARHFVTAQAVIPPQDVSQGVVHIRLIEGKVGRTTVSGNASTRTGYIEDRLHLEPKSLVNLDTLESSLIRFNRTNDVQLRTALQPGVDPGTTDFRIDAVEPKRNDLRVTLDNLGSPTTGRTRLSAAFLHHSLFGRRDDLTLSDTVSKGDNSSGIGYGMPVNTYGGRVDLGFNLDKTAIKQGGLQSLNITGESRAWTLTLRQPTYLTQRTQLDFIAGVVRRDSTNWIDDVFLNDTRTRSKNLGVELQLFRDKDYGFASWTRSFCTATVLTPVKLIIDRGSVRYNHDFSQGISLNSSYTWQAAPIKSIPSSEQFFIGGDASVVGYTVAGESGYNGQVVDFDLHHPLAVWTLWNQKVVATGVFSVDYGTVTPFLPPGSGLVGHDHLAGLGWGVNAAVGRRVNARVSWGYGMTSGTNKLRDKILLFQVMSSVL